MVLRTKCKIQLKAHHKQEINKQKGDLAQASVLSSETRERNVHRGANQEEQNAGGKVRGWRSEI